jgi:hypothetical protein
MQVHDPGSILPANVALGTNTVNRVFETIRINGGKKYGIKRISKKRKSRRQQKSPVGKTKRKRTNRMLPLLHWKCV